MLKNRKFGVFLPIVFVLALEAALYAEPYKNSFVNPVVGSDAKTCGTRKQPCKFIANALSNTRAGGTITLLYAFDDDYDTADACRNPYDNVLKINKSITIQARKGLKTKPCFIVSETAGIGISIDAEGETPNVVKLKGLRIVGGDKSTNGVSFNKGSELFVENCYFLGMRYALNLYSGNLKIKNSTFDSTQYNVTEKAIILHSGSSPKSALIINCHFFKIGDKALTLGNNDSAEIKNSDFNESKNLFDLGVDSTLKLNGVIIKTAGNNK